MHACGLDHPTRSHFDAQAFMELGTPGVGGTGAGWLTRHFQTAGNLPPDIIMPSLAVGSSQQASLLGNLETINMEDPDSFALDNIGHWEWRQAQRVALRQMINSDTDPVHQTSLQALDAVGIIETYVSGNYTPANGAVYPEQRVRRADVPDRAPGQAEPGAPRGHHRLRRLGHPRRAGHRLHRLLREPAWPR